MIVFEKRQTYDAAAQPHLAKRMFIIYLSLFS